MNGLKEKLGRVFAAGPEGLPAWAAALFAAALAAWAGLFAAPGAFDPLYSLYVDSSSFYWIQALWDRSLFEGDPLAAFYYSQLFKPGPEALWVWITALFMKTSPYTLGLKALAALGCAAAALMVRRLAEASPARAAAGTAAALFAVLFLSMDTFFGAPRIYGALTVIGFAWAAEKRRFLLLPALTALGFAVYPSSAAGLGLASALAPFFFREDFAARRLLPRYLGALAAGAAACLLLLWLSALVRNASPEVSHLESFESAKYHQMVSAPLDPGHPVDAVANFVLNLNEHGRQYAVFAALLALLYGLGALALPRRPALLPRSLPLLLAGCVAAFAALYPLHPVSASRQLVFAVPLLLVFLAAEGLHVIFGARLRAAGVAAVFGLLFAGLHPFYNEILTMRRYAGAYAFLAGTPKDAVAAGYPESHLAITVPVFAARQAFMSGETADQELLFVHTPQEYAERRAALLGALYCAPGAAGRLAGLGAGWLLAEKKYYSEAFLAAAADSPVPADREAAALFGAGPGPEACYESLRAAAAYEWKNDASEGVIVPLRREAAR